ncbi:MAG: hypothetical protein M1819_002902 [Sarea resinae]|nr:MAG: hypothetical protein M1819_002902 [Sarea resinae]
MTAPIITVVGSLNADLVTRCSRLPNGGETLTALDFSTGSGGKGANQAVACARLSRPRHSKGQPDVVVRMVGAVGDDVFGRDLVAGLTKDGIDVSDVRVLESQKTGNAVIIVEEGTGENRILLSPNANHSWPETFAGFSEPLPAVVVLQLEIPLQTVLSCIRVAKEKGVQVLLNPAPAVELPKDIYKDITHLILNETEAALLAGAKVEDLADGYWIPSVAERFLALGVENVVITLGAKGAYFSAKGGYEGHIPAEEVKVIDTTAAGDTFVGAYAVEAARHAAQGDFNIGEACEWANRASAKTVEKNGAQSAIPFMDEIPTPSQKEAEQPQN